MNVRISIACDNAAFEQPSVEVCRILRELAARLERLGDIAAAPDTRLSLSDGNGNKVGRYETRDAVLTFEQWWTAEIVPTECRDTREIAKPIAKAAWEAKWCE